MGPSISVFRILCVCVSIVPVSGTGCKEGGLVWLSIGVFPIVIIISLSIARVVAIILLSSPPSVIVAIAVSTSTVSSSTSIVVLSRGVVSGGVWSVPCVCGSCMGSVV